MLITLRALEAPARHYIVVNSRLLITVFHLKVPFRIDVIQ